MLATRNRIALAAVMVVLIVGHAAADRGLSPAALGLDGRPAAAVIAGAVDTGETRVVPTNESRSGGSQELEYHPVILDADGSASPASLDALVTSLCAEMQDERTQIVVMVHGFRNSQGNSTKDYRDISRRLHREAEGIGLKLATVGVHWPGDPGPMRSWPLRALGHRITSLLGIHGALKNPYLEKVRVARQTGRTGLRAVLLRLQEAFPEARVHVFAHSLGAEVILSALAPEGAKCGGDAQPIERPNQELRVGMVVLAGADLDEDLFVCKSSAAIRPALDRAQVWWVTVPEPGKGDGMLELRRGAGRGDAIGNRRLQLAPEDLDRLLERGALVVDEGNIPTWHRLPKYYNDRRLKALTASLLYLQQPDAPKARESRLAVLDAVRNAEPDALDALTSVADVSTRVYACWRLGLLSGEREHIKLVQRKSASPGPVARTAGSRLEHREFPGRGEGAR